MNIKKNITIEADTEKVWSFITDFDKVQQWNENILKIKSISSGETGPGFRSSILMREGRKEVWYNEEILEYQPPSLLKIKLTGGSLGKSPMSINYQLVQKDENVHLNYQTQWEPKGIIYKLLHGLIESATQKNMEKELEALKHAVEE